eukprot:6116775-Heterocapsa_arctica.AAC.1
MDSRVSINRGVVAATLRGSAAAPIVLELRVEFLGAELGVVQHPLHVVVVVVGELHQVASRHPPSSIAELDIIALCPRSPGPRP